MGDVLKRLERNALLGLGFTSLVALAATGGCSAILGIPGDVVEADAAPTATVPVQDAQTPVEAASDAKVEPVDASDGGEDAADATVDATPDAGPPACDVTKEFDTPVLIPSLSTSGHEGEARFPGDDELTVMYDAIRGTPATTDIYTATRPSLADPFGTPVKLVGPVSSDEYEQAGNITQDGLTLFFERQLRSTSVSKIYSATRANKTDPFGTPAPIDINTGNYTAMPFVRGDGKQIYHVSVNGPAATKIFLATFVPGTGYVQTEISEVNLTKSNGTAAYQFAPVISPNGLTLFFATTNHVVSPTLNDTDIWVATRASVADKFSNPRAVANVNTPQDEEPSWITADGCRLYLQSTRPGGAGAQDIYVATRPK